ncbi:MAG: hypothetical protein KC620_16930, partial [Myxococcales bacterium]|nr:hypothetical protein [Myxococcales bacterium]
MNAVALLWLLAMPKGGAVFEKCDLCHISTDWQTMQGGAAAFDHDPTGFPLRGMHRAAQCNDCHGERPLADGACTNCHVDPHRGEQKGTCDACHDSSGWRIPQARQDHRRFRLPLVGRHAGVPCLDCHPRANGDEFRAVPNDCANCHLAQAMDPGVHPAHNEGRFRTECDACHTAFGWRPASVAHARFWPLTGAHRAADCDRCHVGGRFAGTPKDCFACHGD